MSAPYLTTDQVYGLNDKHGWFQHADAQGDVSRAFAQDAIEMHERMRKAAPDLLAALQALLERVECLGFPEGGLDGLQELHDATGPAAAAIARATGAA